MHCADLDFRQLTYQTSVLTDDKTGKGNLEIQLGMWTIAFRRNEVQVPRGFVPRVLNLVHMLDWNLCLGKTYRTCTHRLEAKRISN